MLEAFYHVIPFDMMDLLDPHDQMLIWTHVTSHATIELIRVVAQYIYWTVLRPLGDECACRLKEDNDRENGSETILRHHLAHAPTGNMNEQRETTTQHPNDVDTHDSGGVCDLDPHCRSNAHHHRGRATTKWTTPATPSSSSSFSSSPLRPDSDIEALLVSITEEFETIRSAIHVAVKPQTVSRGAPPVLALFVLSIRVTLETIYRNTYPTWLDESSSRVEVRHTSLFLTLFSFSCARSIILCMCVCVSGWRRHM
jgi:hypothetical protein